MSRSSRVHLARGGCRLIPAPLFKFFEFARRWWSQGVESNTVSLCRKEGKKQSRGTARKNFTRPASDVFGVKFVQGWRGPRKHIVLIDSAASIGRVKYGPGRRSKPDSYLNYGGSCKAECPRA